jgi:hypothetical protein
MDQYGTPNSTQTLLASMQFHNWYRYLSEQLVVIALADDDFSEEIKMMLQQLVGLDNQEPFKMGKPELPVICMSTQPHELIGPQSWLLLKMAEVDKGDEEN